ncbi:bacterial transcriptional activator domain-containing protein [Nocardioides sp. 503]|uniref:AfsR/SARP family transcriptional regulator n=1 Tax=Nocardioides sp. 503 TaxID=2508326 RepID=UPI00106FD84D|nr:bacterial transcriptional activator domain-containing protein [Nocardioides sp. 503]
MRPQNNIKIEVLGELVARRCDGTIVGHDEWRTGQTRDLLRILALNNGRRLRRASVAEQLWPNVSLDRARASLRTAGSQIRSALGSDCLVRHGDGFALEGVWVDVAVFQEDARRVYSLTRVGRHKRALCLAQAAERLYRDDFHAHDDESPWARTEREHLRRMRMVMLCQAAESANAIEDYPRAVALADTAVTIDPTSEAARRALMVGHAGLGEIGSALRVFEELRAHLAEDLGADPSAQTKELHLRLLRGGPV